MSQVPNFAKVDFADSAMPGGKAKAAPWITPEGIAVKPIYDEQDLAGLDFLSTYPGKPPWRASRSTPSTTCAHCFQASRSTR
jgi:methylmalonyl-CoA mutase